MQTHPKITLIGAGPGDAELLTIKGARALSTAKVVLYDALVQPEILNYAPAAALKIYVGKRAGQHKFKQERINAMLVDYARKYGHVVRLKGGDPFIFGRGYEEIEFAENQGIDIEVVPGISALGLAGLHKTPLTCRGINHSFWAVTATSSAGTLSEEVSLVAQSNATAVIYMGVRKLPQIVDLYQQNDKGKLPVLIVQNGSTSNERVLFATIDTILEAAEKEGVQSPAVIYIGKSMGLYAKNASHNFSGAASVGRAPQPEKTKPQAAATSKLRAKAVNLLSKLPILF